MPTPDCAIGVFLSLVIRESFQESTLQKEHLPPSSGECFGRPADWHQAWSASFVPHCAVRHPAPSFHSSPAPHASPPASASVRRRCLDRARYRPRTNHITHSHQAPHLASVIMFRSCLTPHHDSSPAPRTEATKTLHREGERTLNIARSHCRWRSCRLKWNLFAARPLFHLTRHALQRPESCIGFAVDLKTPFCTEGKGRLDIKSECSG